MYNGFKGSLEEINAVGAANCFFSVGVREEQEDRNEGGTLGGKCIDR